MSKYGLGTHEHTLPTQRLHPDRVLLAGLQVCDGVAGEQGGVVEGFMVVDSEHRD